MAYSYRSRRSVKRYTQKSKRNLIVTLILVGFLLYATLVWILPTLINGVGTVKNILHPNDKNTQNQTLDEAIAPPVLTIPFEATNSSTIDISGYSTPGQEVEVYLEDDLKDTVKVKEDGSFIFQNLELSLGTNNISGKTKNGEKLSLSSKQFKVIFDNEKPKLEISEPEDGKEIQGERKIKVSGKTEGQDGVRVYINDSQVIIDKDSAFSKEFSLSDGDNIFTIKAVDSASNITEISRRISFTP